MDLDLFRQFGQMLALAVVSRSSERRLLSRVGGDRAKELIQPLLLGHISLLNDPHRSLLLPGYTILHELKLPFEVVQLFIDLVSIGWDEALENDILFAVPPVIVIRETTALLWLRELLDALQLVVVNWTDLRLALNGLRHGAV